jgi:hypothetical protein
MFRSFRVPARLFAVATWLVSLVFAGFLIGLGGKLVAELPGVDQRLELRDFLDPVQVAPLRARADSLREAVRVAQSARERAAQAQVGARNQYTAQREVFDAWIATRTATTDPRQDPEVIARTRALDSLKGVEREAEAVVERLDTQLIALSQSAEAVREQEMRLEIGALGSFERARFLRELTVFGVRLALTLPLLVLAGWLVARQRHNEYWPLLRGFVIFAVFVFFVELVPYLPSYGGYVRYGVGVLVTGIVGIWLIRAMRRYLARREEAERRTEEERRRSLPYEEAIRRIDGGVCPGCERAVARGPNGMANFCVHCGLRLFDECPACHVPRNAFYPYCPQCGVPADAAVATPTTP